ncbi:hypothetical protein ABZ801_01170 [Actinomadura sp. NPDC047616]|uniref:hypothetical protein n=1 Tax=Actinomadura sp. NPDC047616 TaxID=3155914 RepID=UPI0034113D1E
MTQPSEKAATSLRLEAPGLGFGLDDNEVEAFMAATEQGLIVPETPCDKGMQDNYALRHEATATLSTSA